MTRKQLNEKIDRILLAIADANELDISDKATVGIAQSLLGVALDKHAAELVRSGTASNRIKQMAAVA